MTVPGRADATALLLSLQPPPWFVRHARAVAEVASWLAVRCQRRGVPVQRRLVETAALLHDVDKLLPGDDPASGFPHGEGSAAWLTAQGYGELTSAVRSHPVTRLADPSWAAWLAAASPEERLVAYADKRAGQRLEPMTARFRSWDRRYPGGWPGEIRDLVWHHALALETDVCRAAGIEPGEVRRLAWTGAALRAALRTARNGRPR